MLRILLAALIGSLVGAMLPASASELPKIEALIFSSEIPSAQVAQHLESESLAAGSGGYIIPISSGTKERLLERLAVISPVLLADADHQASTVAGTAVDLVQGQEAITLRIKALSIQGERLAAWYGIKRSTSGNGAPHPLSQKPLRVDLAYGEALVTEVGNGLWAAFIPGPFDAEPVISQPQQPGAELPPLTPAPAPIAQEPDHPRIQWDASPGATLPDQEALERILGR